MSKIILVTGATAGIGQLAATKLAAAGHHVLLHGRSPAKLDKLVSELRSRHPDAQLDTYAADLSTLAATEALAARVLADHTRLDVLINNAGVYKTRQARTPDDLDLRFAVNTLAPYLLTTRLRPLLGSSGRVVNLSSAAQAPFSLDALGSPPCLGDHAAYAQSKLALTAWTRVLAAEPDMPMIVAVNPGSLLATSMVKDAFGVAGKDVNIGADILVRAALSDEFAEASGLYFDNDAGRFAPPHPDALDDAKGAALITAMDAILDR